jgi:hypothetical protein
MFTPNGGKDIPHTTLSYDILNDDDTVDATSTLGDTLQLKLTYNPNVDDVSYTVSIKPLKKIHLTLIAADGTSQNIYLLKDEPITSYYMI